MATYAYNAAACLKAGVSYSRAVLYVAHSPSRDRDLDTRLTNRRLCRLPATPPQVSSSDTFAVARAMETTRSTPRERVKASSPDDWRVTSRQPINIGLRHEVKSPPYYTTDQGEHS